jgi:hypothetical protein
MRCKLVHNYTEGGKYAFIHNHSELHLEQDQHGRIIINLRSFINELKKAQVNFFNEVRNNDSLKMKVAKRYKKVGILGPAAL